MAGVTARKYADGAWRIWYIDRAGKQKFAKGTRNKRESHQWAKALELQERGMSLGIYAEPPAEELHRDDIVSAYIAWGEAQGGLIGGAWSPTHASEKRAKLPTGRKTFGWKPWGTCRASCRWPKPACGN